MQYDHDRVKRKRRLRVSDPDFVPPDGGWGWLVVFSSGFTTLCVIAIFQQFGLIFRARFAELGITQTQTTTIINVGAAMYSGVGLANGPLFRSFTYRQVCLAGSFSVVLSILACIFCSSFWSYICVYSIVYGTSFGVVQSSVSIALNTYFKEKRRIATGLSWTATALGPVIWPYVIVASNAYYGITGTLLLFAGLAMQALVCGLLLQPVEWHTKFKEEYGSDSERGSLLKRREDNNESTQISEKTNRNSLGSSYEIVGLSIPTMNEDGYFPSRSQRSSRQSLHSLPTYSRKVSFASSFVNVDTSVENKDGGDNDLSRINASNLYKTEECPDKQLDGSERLSVWKKISIFFDFDLFKDLVYVNIMVGMTIASFVEINFSILTPIILKEFNFPEIDVATFMSLLGTTDIILRFTIPFVADRIGWSNRTFFLIGVMSMALSRILLIHTQTYYVSLLVAVILGAGKALRTIFFNLVIPSHVPLERLPAASGLQLAFGGLVFIVLGPLIGWIRQMVGNYVITIHILNLYTYATTISWIVEFLITERKKNNKDSTSVKSEENK